MSFVPTLEHGSTVSAPAAPAQRHRWITALVDLVFPPFCPVCEARLDETRRFPLCGSCWERIPRISAPFCRLCGLPFGDLDALGRPERPAATPLCGRCRRRPPAFAYARSAARYDEVARAAVHAFKFDGCRALAIPLGEMVAQLRATLPLPEPDLLVPVPLHPRRERERGFNQALLLARRVGRAWRVPVRGDVLQRTMYTVPQTQLSGEARRSNVRAAFAVRRPEVVAGRHVVLVDDVFTTGSTGGACALGLKRAGAAAVGVLTVARAL
jgi:ComF family protein